MPCSVAGLGVKAEDNVVPALEGVVPHWARQTRRQTILAVGTGAAMEGGRGRGEQGMGTLPAQGDASTLRLEDEREVYSHTGHEGQEGHKDPGGLLSMETN